MSLFLMPVVLVSCLVGISFFSESALADRCESLFSETLSIEITESRASEVIPHLPDWFRPAMVNIRTSRGELRLHEMSRVVVEKTETLDFSSAARVEVVVASSEGQRKWLDVPEWLTQNLRDYIRKGGPTTTPFDCNCFVHVLNGLPYQFELFSTKLWRLQMVTDESLVNVGDTILLGYSVGEVKHVAVALGEGFYISKFGTEGPVFITDFATLQFAYGGFLFAKASPLHRSSSGKTEEP